MTNSRTRREVVVGGLAAGALGRSGFAQPATDRSARPRVVVVGGGAGGATAARLIARGGGGEIEVTLVEAQAVYRSCFFSNHYLGGLRDLDSITHRYDRLEDPGLKVRTERALAIDRIARKVELANDSLNYDKLILAPGIAMKEDSVQGWTPEDSDRMPHAYTGGEQVRILRRQIESMYPGGVFGMIVPAGDYRCPPGPYERATAIAHRLKQINPAAKIIIADPKPLFSKQGLFREAWKIHYEGMIDHISDVDMSELRVDPAAMTMTIGGETIRLAACNVIPAQRAGDIAHSARLTEGDWAPVEPLMLGSALDEDVHILGDAADQGDMPKSAFAANSQAMSCAEGVVSRLLDRPLPEPVYRNTCWSFLSPGNSVKIGATYRPSEGRIAYVDGFVSRSGETAEIRSDTFAESLKWYEDLTREMFGSITKGESN